MPTYDISVRTIQANNLVVSTPPGAVVPANMQGARIQLVEDGQWGTTPSTNQFVKIWGMQIDRQDGLGFVWWLYQGHETDTNLWLPFGTRDRSGGMPALSMDSTRVLEAQGLPVRMGVLTNANTRLGATMIVGTPTLRGAG
jgi:hypothetical protein